MRTKRKLYENKSNDFWYSSNLSYFHLHLDGNVLEAIDCFKYLGIIFSSLVNILMSRLGKQCICSWKEFGI